MMVAVFEYTERVVNMIRPRKLLFMAIGSLAAFSFTDCVTYDSFFKQTASHLELR